MNRFLLALFALIPIERLSRCGVKVVMNVARMILICLWPFFWLTASSRAQVGMVRPANDTPAAFARAAAYENQDGHDFIGIHYRSTSRFNRRFDFSPDPNDTPVTLSHFQADVSRDESTFHSHAGFRDCLGLANGWQFRWRTALSPRAPSLVS
jgi:hypothetical protein